MNTKTMKIRLISYFRRVAAIAASICALILCGDIAAAGERIAVLLSSQEAPFTEALGGFQELLKREGIQAEYEVYRLNGDAPAMEQEARKAGESGIRIVLTLGTSATDAAIKQINDIPIIACLVMRLDVVKKASNATGVGLEFPLDVQFDRLQAILPRARNVGIIYNPAENGQRINAAKSIAQAKGLGIVAEEVHAPQDIPAALTALSRKADVLLSMPDSITLSPQMAKPLLLFSFRNSIPFIGLSSTWVKAGALYALDRDYADLGMQAGEMALKVLRGASPSSIPPASPRKVQLSLNLRTAEQMNITISARLVHDARQTY